jgi:AraC-like DNA-binding protein
MLGVFGGRARIACGFNDISYFNRSFRRRFGASPLHYRGVDSQQR